MIVWLASYPRSGNDFVLTILSRLHGNPVSSVFSETESAIAALAQSTQVHVVKTHLLPNGHHPAIYLLRDGRDSTLSFAKHKESRKAYVHPSQLPADVVHQRLRHLIINRNHRFGTWSMNVEAWTARPHTHTIRFEELIQHPIEQLEAAFKVLNLPSLKTNGRPPTFNELQQERPRHYRRGIIGSYKDEFPRDLLALFHEHHGKTLKRFGF